MIRKRKNRGSLSKGLTDHFQAVRVETCSREGVGSKNHLGYYSGPKRDREVMIWKYGVGFDLKVVSANIPAST